MNDSPQLSSERPWTGRMVLVAIAAFFAVIIAVNVTMATIASRTWTGLVVANSYVASQNFNAELESARQQAAHGWRSQLAYRDDRIVFTLSDSHGQPITGAQLTMSLGRPAFEAEDRQVALAATADGEYRADVTLAPGHWSARIDGDIAGAAFRRDSRFMVRDPPGGGQ